MKILFPINAFFPAQRGPSNTVYWHTKALYNNNIKPTVVTTNNHIKENLIEYNKFLEASFGRVIYNRESNYKLPKNLILSMIKEIKKTDIVHLSSLLYPPSLIAALFCRIYNKKIVWSIRGELEKGALNNKFLLKKIYTLIARLLVNKNTIFHATSEQEKKNIKLYFPNSNIVLIPNYIELPQKNNIETKKTLLFLGRINRIKAIENLISALSLSNEFIRSEFKMNIVGPIDDTEYLKELKELTNNLNLNQKINFMDKVEGEKKEKLLAESYFLILPSHSENFGNVVLEALSQGTPVVASKGTPWSDLEKEKIGYWRENSPTSLSITINEIVNLDKEIYDEMSNKSHLYVKNKYCVKENIYQWINVYQELIDYKF